MRPCALASDIAFYRAAAMQPRYSHERSVRPSVCQTRGLWQNERNFCPNCYTAQKFDESSFATRRMVDGRYPILPYL